MNLNIKLFIDDEAAEVDHDALPIRTFGRWRHISILISLICFAKGMTTAMATYAKSDKRIARACSR